MSPHGPLGFGRLFDATAAMTAPRSRVESSFPGLFSQFLHARAARTPRRCGHGPGALSLVTSQLWPSSTMPNPTSRVRLRPAPPPQRAGAPSHRSPHRVVASTSVTSAGNLHRLATVADASWWHCCKAIGAWRDRTRFRVLCSAQHDECRPLSPMSWSSPHRKAYSEARA